MKMYRILSLDDWQVVLDELVPRLHSGSVLTLSGPLGAGKTTFTQLLAKRFGLETGAKSPTFALMRIHPLPVMVQGILKLVHIDAYRLEKPEDAYALDLEELVVTPGNLMVIEWPEQMEQALKRFTSKRISIRIELKEGERIVGVE